MKILFIPSSGNGDYMQDMVFHGLREQFGPEVIDYHRMYYMYKGADTAELYGKGFTLYGLLDDAGIDRNDLELKIATKYFDYVFFGSVQREHKMYGKIAEYYPAQKIIFIDGEDGPLYLKSAADKGIYFKRELHSPKPGVFPIQFAIPEEKCRTKTAKLQIMAYIDPFDSRTYIYNDEESYYGDYSASLFGKTMKKAGWDCLRHYEILACMCLPLFENVEHCPHTIMMDYPKEECFALNNLIEEKGMGIFQNQEGLDFWSELMQKCSKILREKLTTKALALRLIDTVRSL